MRAIPRVFGCAVAVLVAGAIWLPAAGATELSLPSGFRDTTVLEHLISPTAVRFAPAPSDQIFIAGKEGEINVFDGLEDESPTLFADLRTQVYDNGDRGLLGMVLDPDFSTNHYVYVLYTYDHVLGNPGGAPEWGLPNHAGDECPKPGTADVDSCPVSGRLVRFTEVSEHATEEKVLITDWCQTNSSHSIGDLQFGPEGALYVSGGEGASFTSADYGQFGWPEVNECGDPPGGKGVKLAPPTAEGGALRSQDVQTPEDPFSHTDPTSLDGTLIRIDPETGEGWPTNPMASSADPNARRIVAFGFRNPFRFALDPTGGEVYVDNVGSDYYEEIDNFRTDSESLYNSGWPCFEGPERQPLYKGLGLTLCESLYQEPGAASVSQPLYDYSHFSGVFPQDPCPYQSGSAISGVLIHPGGGSFPQEYENALFFADSVRACIYVMLADDDGHPDPSTLQDFGIGKQEHYPGVDLEIGPEGDLYYVEMLGDSYGPGALHRISYDPGAPIARLKADKLWGKSLPLTVSLDASDSEDPDGEELSYEWEFDEEGNFEVGVDQEELELTEPVNQTVRVRVKDGTGASSVARITLYPGDEPPVLTFSKPTETKPGSGLANFKWSVGKPIEFKGSAKDADGNALGHDHLYWDLRLLHCPSSPTNCHPHPLQVFPSVSSGQLLAPDHDYPSHIDLTLTATDKRGLSATHTMRLDPKTVVLNFKSEPAGVPLTAGLVAQATPFSLTAIEGANLTVTAPETLSLGGTGYVFDKWSDGEERIHTVAAVASATYTASYSVDPAQKAQREKEAREKKEQEERERSKGTPPATPKISGHPAKTTRGRTARFAFSSNPAGTGYRCKLDKAAFRPCVSPQRYRHLKPGKHVFKVVAVDGTTSLTSTPATFSWKVRR